MNLIKLKKGVDIPISGQPEPVVYMGNSVSRVALIGYDYLGLKPKFMVSPGEKVKLGQVLFVDKMLPGVKFTSPACGKIMAINRGAKRVLESLVIELEGEDEITFDSFKEDELVSLGRKKVCSLLLDSGLWTSFRTRPFSKVPHPDSVPHSIFITAMDSNPLAPDMGKIFAGNEISLINGIRVISNLTEGTLFINKSPDLDLPEIKLSSLLVTNFSGPHPAGNAGTHIHFLDPVNLHKSVWYIDLQDVLAVGKLFTTGKIPVSRIISLAGPGVSKPRLLQIRMGGSIEDITRGELIEGKNRILSGSVLSGRQTTATVNFLGRYHQQISVLPESGKREFLGWLKPGLREFSVKNVVLSKMFRKRKFDFTTDKYGEERGIVPIGSYEKVMPLDILPTFLLRSLVTNDIEEAQKLGCLELDEEDLALCTFVCPSKIEYGSILRRNLVQIEKE